MKAANSNNKCPICKGVSTQKYHPFCSNRCSEIDLSRWFKGNYIIPGEKTSQGQNENEDSEG